uniref:Uncharacterized protein n=1 Tax=Avena sativa TaxID=4498 RepID=A0ACD6ANF1_AVESA
MVGEWSVGLFDCFGDCGTCCLTLWCPCVTFGRIAEIVDKGSTSCCMNGTIYVCLACLLVLLYQTLGDAVAVQLGRIALHGLLRPLLL